MFSMPMSAWIEREFPLHTLEPFTRRLGIGWRIDNAQRH
jgi:hypothetical protein